MGELKETNTDLELQVSRLERAERELHSVNSSLKATTRNYEDNIEKFRTLDDRLHSLGDDSIAGMQKLKEMSKTVQSSIQREMVKHEREIIYTVQEALEYGDGKDGLDEAEFNRFVAALPKNFRKRFESMNQTFDDLACEDGIVDMNEFTDLADRFAEE